MAFARFVTPATDAATVLQNYRYRVRSIQPEHQTRDIGKLRTAGWK
jgi:hypothetical protein